jgi:phytoene dehydrogenase-like protein
MKTAVVIGAGHNGLTAAFYLAKAGIKPVVLEARSEVGGGAITAEIHPGFHCPALTHEVLLQQRIVQEMDLERHGLEQLRSSASICALSLSGPALLIDDRVEQTQASIRRFSAKDADTFPVFRTAIDRVARVLGSTFEYTPPPIDRPGATDLWNLLKTFRAFRSLGKRDAHRLLRWGPMPVADLVTEWFEHDLLRAAIAAPALTGTMLAPRSAGSSLVLLLREAHRQLAGGPLRAKGGPGAASRALAAAARAAGADIRTSASVERIVVKDNAAQGVVAGGQTIGADVVVSAVDPKTTFLRLIEPSELSPDFALKVQNYRASGTLAKVNLALASLPDFGCGSESLTGRILIAPHLDYLERAFDHIKYGECSAQPWLELTIPSLLDSSLAPSGAHVASVYVHYAPRHLRSDDWAGARDALLSSVFAVLEQYAPDIRTQTVAAQVLTPFDLERDYGLAGGHIFHGELALDQLFTMRPILGHARYTTPVRGLYLCGAGTHPGGFMTGGSGRLAVKAITASEI